MQRCRFVWALLLLAAPALHAETFSPEPASGPPTIAASYPIDGQPAVVLGKLAVSGAGRVTLLANREKNRLVLKAVGTDGAQLGRAESVVGIGDTPIYVRSSNGLRKIIVHWKS